MSAVRAIRWGGLLTAAAALIVLAWLSPPATVSPAELAPLAPQATPERQGVSFTVPGNDPLASLGVEPADVLGVGSAPLILCAQAGLTCADAGAGDMIEGLSFGQDFRPTGVMPIQFAVSAASRGITGTEVRAEANCTPAEPQADVFGSALDGSNAQVWDGDGVACGSNDSPPLYLAEGAYSSRVNALDLETCPHADWNCDGIPDEPFLVTLAAGSSTLTATGATAADILIVNAGVEPAKWADGVIDLGLVSGDMIDALCVKESGDGVYDSEDIVLFSLAPGSPSLATGSASAADLWLPGHPAVPFYKAAQLGLQSSDDVTAVMCSFDLSLSRVYLPIVMRQ